MPSFSCAKQCDRHLYTSNLRSLYKFRHTSSTTTAIYLVLVPVTKLERCCFAKLVLPLSLRLVALETRRSARRGKYLRKAEQATAGREGTVVVPL
eukprot:TRINITY_DN3362_c0_g1_i1.p1 TRINITY_DN3362_c0_g1~~TRINITY_DN3362_c0_g1_i1.p1  ORF type:complete len:95 (+),score=3.15 TRINITY_DN3362_c0_g1_i1:41-325(+)